QPQHRETVVANYRKNFVEHVANSAAVAGNSHKLDDVASLINGPIRNIVVNRSNFPVL
ncbi:hypothetical protein IAF17_18725, partial [Acinetobacter baumannii]|nr:hypothetical protein [Acinetobacter baumannii]